MSRSDEQRSPRVRTSIAAVLVDSDGGEIPVEVTDLSSGGFRLRAGEALVAGEDIRLRVPRYGDFPARIQWVQGEEAGANSLRESRFSEGGIVMAGEKDRRESERRQKERRSGESGGSSPAGVERRRGERREGERRDEE